MKQNSEQETMDALSQIIDLRQKDLLEIGCGDGRLTAGLVEASMSVTAVDPDEERIEMARRQVSGATFSVGSGECLAFSDARFDVVLFSLSLHHQDSALALSEAFRVLKDDGSLLVIEPLNEGGLERVCTVLHDEEEAIRMAQAAISEREWILEASRDITAQWVFEAPLEFFSWIFNYYGIPFDGERARQMAALPGVYLERRPIVLEDWMEVQRFKKGGSSQPRPF